MTKAGGGVAAAGRVLLALLVGALGVVALPRPVTAPAIAAAITPETAFEIDGDIPVDGLGDWGDPVGSGIYGPGTTPGGLRTTGILSSVIEVDVDPSDPADQPCDGSDGSALPGNQTINDIPWSVGPANANNKADVCVIAAAVEVVEVPPSQFHIIYYTMWARSPTATGDVSIFQIFEGPQAGRCDDLLLEFDLDPAAGGSIDFTIKSWSPDLADGCADPAGSGEWVDDSTFSVPNAIIDAALGVNDFIGPGADDPNDATFGEMAINLTTLGLLPEDSCASFTSPGVISKTGESDTSQLVDAVVFAEPLEIGNCGEVTITKASSPPGVSGGPFGYGIFHEDGRAAHDASLVGDGDDATEPDGDLESIEGTLTLATDVSDAWSNVIGSPDFQVDESSLPANWELVDIRCDFYDLFAGERVTDFVIHDGSGLIDVFQVVPSSFGALLGVDVSSSCAITNATQSLTVVKDVINDDGGTAMADDFDLRVNGAPVASGQANAYPADAPLTVSETLVDGYAQVGGIVCEDDVTGAGVDHPVTLTDGQAVTCTITNDDIAPLLTLEKVVENSSGGDATDTDFTLTASGPVTISGVEGDPSVTSASVSAGTYALSETGPAGYLAGAWVCEGPGLVAPTPTVIGLALAAEVTCTLTNVDVAPQLTVVKDVDAVFGGDAVATDFVLRVDGANGDTYPNLVSGDVLDGTSTPPLVSNLAYAVSETPVDGYEQTGVVCVDDVTGAGVGHPVTLGEGQAVTCTLTNVDVAPQLTVVKEIINDTGSDGVPSDFVLRVDGANGDTYPNLVSGDVLDGASTPPLMSNLAYAVSETPVDGYEQTGVVCVDDVTGAGVGHPVTLVEGQAVTCTLTNRRLPELTVDKTVISGPILNADGTYTVVYRIDIANTGGLGVYDLADEPQLGDGVVAVDAASVNVAPGTIATNPGFDGVSETVIVTDVEIVDDETHSYEVTIVAEVASSITVNGRDCVLQQGELGTGFGNVAIVEVEGGELQDFGCAEVPGPGVDVAKNVASGPTVLSDGTYELIYEIVVMNTGDGPGAYELTDTPAFGDAVSVVSIAAVNTTPGTISVNPGFDGATDQLIVGSTGIRPNESHVYELTVVAAVATDVTVEERNCTIGGSETGTGFLNGAVVAVDGEEFAADACVGVPNAIVEVDKLVAGDPVHLGDGSFAVVYEVVVTSVGEGPGQYDAFDALAFTDAVTVDAVTVTSTDPAGLPFNPSFDGVSDTALATAVGIGVGDVHVYEVTVVASTLASVDTVSRDCRLGDDEVGTGFLNTVTVRVDGQELRADACAEVPHIADLFVDKSDDVLESVLPGESFSYAIVVGNAGPHDAEAEATVSDTLPSELAFVRFASTGAAVCTDPDAGGVFSCVVPAGALGAGAQVTIVVDVVVRAGTPSTTVTNIVTVTSLDDPVPGPLQCPESPQGTDDPREHGTWTPAPNVACVDTVLGSVADLAVSKTPDDEAVEPGEPVTWTVTVGNLGPGTAIDVILTDVLPQGISVTNLEAPAGVACGPVVDAMLTCDLGSIGPQESVTIAVEAAIDDEVQGATLINLAAVGSSTPDVAMENNVDQGSVLVGMLPRTGGSIEFLTKVGVLGIGLGLVLLAGSRGRRREHARSRA